MDARGLDEARRLRGLAIPPCPSATPEDVARRAMAGSMHAPPRQLTTDERCTATTLRRLEHQRDMAREGRWIWRVVAALGWLLAFVSLAGII